MGKCWIYKTGWLSGKNSRIELHCNYIYIDIYIVWDSLMIVFSQVRQESRNVADSQILFLDFGIKD